jgi:putative ABC transport system permease protein
VIVNQRFASKYWPGANPVGKRLRLFDRRTPKGEDEGPWRTVVGVVSNIAQNEIARPESNYLVYEPYRQRTVGNMRMIVRTRIPPASLAATIRREIQAIDPDITVWSVGTLEQSFKTLYWKSEFYGSLFLIFAALALLLASFGLYAVIAHSVSQRSQEIGVRIALGGTARDIRGLVLRQGLLPVGVGLTVGLALSLAMNRLLQAQLVQVSPSDLITLAAVSATLIVAAILGCLIPARRAMQVDPLVALRHD